MSIEIELLKEVLEYFDPLGLNTEHCGDLPERIKELLAQPEQEQEPVAWIIETEIHGKLSEWICTDKKHYMEAHDGTKDPIPLYLAQQKREPLSDGEITTNTANNIPIGEKLAFHAGIRWAEQQHGIGVDDESI
jgi:hypothetical protein